MVVGRDNQIEGWEWGHVLLWDVNGANECGTRKGGSWWKRVKVVRMGGECLGK